MVSKRERAGDRQLAQALLALFAMIALAGVVQTNPGPLHDWMPDGVPALVIVLASLGILFLGLFAQHARALNRAGRWPSVVGTVVQSRVLPRKRFPGSAARAFGPDVHVVYTVDGVEYRTSQIHLGAEVAGSKPFAEREAARYPKGASVTLRYNPDAPAEAAIRFTLGLAWLLCGLGVLLLMGALLATGWLF